ncbi:MAG: signal transduction histidine kinase [Patescibacteria group bacterium]|jgi:signal transduction histidine kinase
MTTEKELRLKEAYDYYFMTGFDSSCLLETAEEYFAKNIMGFGTHIDENLFSIDDMLTGIIRQREQSAGIEMNYDIKPVYHNTIANGNAAIFVDELIITMNINSNKNELFLRHTLVIEYLDNKWKVVHFHTSVPVQAESETDTWGIDEWKKRNQELEIMVKERTAELEKSLENLKATQAQLIQSEKMASLGELTAGIAHEIQNPLNFVNNFSEVSEEMIKEIKDERLKTKDKRDEALEDEILSDIEQNLQKINHHGNRASSIVIGMLEHSRTSSGNKELTDINALADEYLRLSYHGLRAKNKDFNAEMVTNFDPTLPKIEVIPQDIGRVLLNLINNAFQAVMEKASMPEAATEPSRSGLEGRVDEASSTLREISAASSASKKYKPTVSISTQLTANSELLIAIKDNGPGIPDEIKDKIFQPFFTTKDTGKGTGLGLSLAYDIVKAHGGELEVDIEGNVGSRFTIKLLKQKEQ